MTETAAKTKLVLITGLSGSGKSTVAKCFEDLGYYCIDNLPLPLLRSFVQDSAGKVEGHDRVAVVTDVRAPGFADEFPRLLQEIDTPSIQTKLLFLEASDDALQQRFSETRRPHPLAGERRAIDGIRQEREMLTEVRGRADLVFDTSEWSVHDTRRHVFAAFTSSPRELPDLVLSLLSFGFKYGTPPGLDLLYDVRFIANPHFVPGLAERTGLDAEVSDYLAELEEWGELMDRIEAFLLFVMPRFRRENRSYVTVGVGCTGGRHRSVAGVEELSARLEAAGWRVHRTHRDVER